MCDFHLLKDSTSDHVRVEDGTLVIDHVVPSDGGVYSCMAVSSYGNASRDVAILSKSFSVFCICALVSLCHFLIFCFSFHVVLTPPPPCLLTLSPAWSASVPISVPWTNVGSLLPQNPTNQWRNTNHKFCLAVEAKSSRTVAGDHGPSFR